MLRELPTEGPTVMQGPAEDAGILHLGEFRGERYGVVIAHESHNHPSQVVPFEGAATGVGGIVRDVLCMGAEVIAIADPLRFGRTEDARSHQRYVAQAAVEGIGAYGNAIGVPNIAGDVYFDQRFDDNCLVNVVALGLVKERDIIHSAAPPDSAGWDIVLVGKATDASGFGGAAFSSVTLDEEDAEANKGAVQVPDPFLKNVIMRASYRVFEYLRAHAIVAGFKDLGAGGIMGCSAELCASGGFGAIIDLDDVNTAMPDMPSEVIAVGETQERLCWVLPPDVTPQVLRIYNQEFTLPDVARGACAVVIGAVQTEQQYVLRRGGEIVMDVPIDFLTGSIRDDLPVHPIAVRPVAENLPREIPDGAGPLAGVLERVLAHRDVASRRSLYERYDGAVRGTTVIARGEADAGVIAPVNGSPLGVALSVAGNPRYSMVDVPRAAEYAVLEAVCKVVAVGARPLGLTDCLNFGNPHNVGHYSELVRSIGGISLAARELGTPFVSGNVSLYNESKSGQAIAASPIIACVGGFDNVGAAISAGLKRAGATLFAVGSPTPAQGGAVVAEVLGERGGALPEIDYERKRREIAFVLAAVKAGALHSARYIGNGGLLAAMCEMIFVARVPLGIAVHVPAEVRSSAGTLAAYFGEGWGWVVESADDASLRALANDIDLTPYARVTGESGLQIDGESIEARLLFDAWSRPLAEVYP